MKVFTEEQLSRFFVLVLRACNDVRIEHSDKFGIDNLQDPFMQGVSVATQECSARIQKLFKAEREIGCLAQKH